MIKYLKVKYVDVINFEAHRKNKKKDRWLEGTDGYVCDKANLAKCSL